MVEWSGGGADEDVRAPRSQGRETQPLQLMIVHANLDLLSADRCLLSAVRLCGA